MDTPKEEVSWVQVYCLHIDLINALELLLLSTATIPGLSFKRTLSVFRLAY